MKAYKYILLFTAALSISSCSQTSIEKSTSDSPEIVELPDGSVAYLNQNSVIEYDEDFSKRIVRQKGEVFYDVKKGDVPFIVNTESGQIRVLGTRFNVESSPGDIEVEVESGSVELKVEKLAKKIEKGQKAVFKDIKKEIKIARAELKHKKWQRKLQRDLKKMGRKLEKSSQKIKDKSKDLGEDAKSRFNKLKDKLEN